MAKQTVKKTEEVKKASCPSQYGSHPSMVDQEATEKLDDPKMVVCVDENGPYITERWKLAGKEADVNRFDERRQKR